MPTWFWFLIPLLAIGIIVAVYLRYKMLKDATESLGLIEGETYEVLQNGGKVNKDLTFIRAYYGNRSKNGSINFEFTKNKKYRDEYITESVVIKFGSIWQVVRLCDGETFETNGS